jgi:hypothetical protein
MEQLRVFLAATIACRLLVVNPSDAGISDFAG